MLVNDYEVKNVRDVICGDFLSNLVIALNKCAGENIRTFTLSNANLTESSIQAGIGNDMTLSISYEAYYNSITGAIDSIF